MEKNLVYDQQLKERLANTALKMLADNNLITNDDYKGLSLHMGYIFLTEEEKVEALFKICFSGKTHYFAAQKGSLMAVNLNEEMYQQTINYMVANHPCLSSDELPETAAQKNRREKNISRIKAMNVVTADKLMSRWDDEQIVLRDKETICKRAVCCFFVIQIACDIANDAYDESIKVIKPIMEKFGVLDQLNSKEQRIVDGTYSMQDAIDMDWAYEAYWSLCWSLGLVDDISDASGVCDCKMAIDFIRSVDSTEEFINKCSLRSKEEILDMLDLYYRYNWAINESTANPGANIGNLNPSVVIERRRGLEWIVSDVDDWYDLDMPA